MTWSNYGAKRINEALTKKQDVTVVAKELADSTNNPSGKEAYAGAMIRAADTIIKLAESKAIRFRNGHAHATPEKTEAAKLVFDYLVTRRDLNGAILKWESLRKQADAKALTAWHEAVFSTLEYARRAIPNGFRFAPQEVQETPKVEPVKIEIVGMPQRLTETTVHRDASGDVASSVQVERDL